MINVNDFKPGVTFQLDGNIYTVIESHHSKTARGQAHVKAKLKNLKTGANINHTFTGGEKVKPAYIKKQKMEFIFKDDSGYIFMDSQTYEQVSVPNKYMDWNKNFLIDGLEVEVIMYEDQIIGINLPQRVNIEVIQADPAVKGNSTSNPQKSITLETGFVIQAPIFIKGGDKIIVDTVTGEYISRK